MITVVDNGSTDGSIGAIASRYPNVRLLPLGENHGFTGGIAAALARIAGAQRRSFSTTMRCRRTAGWRRSSTRSRALRTTSSPSAARSSIRPDELIDFIGGVLTFDGHAFQNGFRYPLGVARRSARRLGAALRLRRQHDLAPRAAPGARRIRRRLFRLSRGRRLRLAHLDRRLARDRTSRAPSSATSRARPASASAISSAAFSSSGTRCRRR